MRLAIALVVALAAAPAAAEVREVRIERRESVLDGRTWGEAGAYEKLAGRIVFALDPAHPANAGIVDLALAPRDAEGLVLATADLAVLRPVDAAKGSGTALLEVSNRGGKASLAYFARARASADPSAEEHFGDGLPLRRGLTLIWVGWQVDVPRQPGRLRLEAPVASQDGESIEGLVRCDWTVDRPEQRLELGHRGHVPYALVDPVHPDNRLTVRDGRDAERREVPPDQWRFADDGASIESEAGFEPGRIYELVYRARDPWVVGLGLAAVRDTLAYAKHGEGCPFPVERGLGVGISQTGRFLRHFLWQGFNTDEQGRQVFDGLLIHTAGAGRGSFNHRFAQPSRDAHRYSAFFFPTDLFPFSGRVQRDPLTGRADGLLARLAERRHVPKVVYTNTGYEYWGRAASLLHTSLDGSADVALLPQERLYHLAGGQHFVGQFPPPERARLDGARAWRGNPLDFLATERALLVALQEWVEAGREPPPSAHPRVDARTLVPLDELAFPGIPGLEAPQVVHAAHRADYGPRWGEGLVEREPPELGPAFPSLVPQVDALGNELGGLRALELLAPLATYCPWSLRDGFPGAEDELVDFLGTIAPLPRTEGERAALGDPRPSLEELYGSREAYLELARTRAAELVEARLLLAEDVGAALDRAAATWDWIAGS